MRRFPFYMTVVAAFAVISSGALIAALGDVFAASGYGAMWLLVPMTVLLMAAVAVHDVLAMPRLLLRGRVTAYFAVTFALAFAVPVAMLALEGTVRSRMGMPQRIASPTSPWILIDTLSNSMLGFLMLAGLGLLGLYRRWTAETRRENRLASGLKAYMAEVRRRLRPAMVMQSLRHINQSLRTEPDRTATLVRQLADTLRTQLYELPAPPAVVTSGREGDCDVSPGMAGFITSGRWRLYRVALFETVLIIISLGVFFNTPDTPEFSLQRLGSAVAMFSLFNVVAWVNILWLFGRFERHRSLRVYLRDVVCFILAVTAPMVAAQVLTYDLNPYSRHTPVWVMLLSTLASASTLALFVAGTSAVLLLRDWMVRRRRVALLHAETARQEYSFLRKQINPHFLFNVLNNIGILSVDDTVEAAGMLAELERLLHYQFAETRRETTRLDSEIDFLNSYLKLEGTRLPRFAYEIVTSGPVGNAIVPTLIFIPFVENAVKHSTETDGMRRVTVSFIINGRELEFECRNTYAATHTPESAVRGGGLGLANTRRRLELLYGNRFRMTSEVGAASYTARVILPLSGSEA